MNDPFRQHPDSALWLIGSRAGKFYWVNQRGLVIETIPCTPENFDVWRQRAWRQRALGPEEIDGIKLVWDGATEGRWANIWRGTELRSDQTGPVLDVGTLATLKSWSDVAQWLQVQNEAWEIERAAAEGEFAAGQGQAEGAQSATKKRL